MGLSPFEFVPQGAELVPVGDGRVRRDGVVQRGAELHVAQHLQVLNIVS